MKKSKIKMLTAAACLALVGTASAAWVYAGTATASANIGVKVAAYASAGTITVNNADNVRVYLDKDSVTFKLIDETKPFSVKYEKPAGFENSSKKVTLTYVAYINNGKTSDDSTGGLFEYIAWADDVETQSDWSLGTKDIEWAEDQILLSNEKNNLPGLQWLDTISDLSEKSNYIEMVNALTGQSIGETFDQEQEWDAINNVGDYFVNFTFKAVVSE